MLDGGKIMIGKCLHGNFSGIGIDAAHVVTEIFQLAPGFLQVVSFQAAFELLAPHLDQRVRWAAGGIRIETRSNVLSITSNIMRS